MINRGAIHARSRRAAEESKHCRRPTNGSFAPFRGPGTGPTYQINHFQPLCFPSFSYAQLHACGTASDFVRNRERAKPSGL